MLQQLINGAWQSANNGNTWDLINPATEEVIAKVPYGNATDAALAIDAAHEAYKTWRKTTPYYRAEILKKVADIIRAKAQTLAEDTARECGKPIVEAKGEWLVAANLFEWYAEEGKRSYGRVIPTNRADKRTQVILQPIGVVGCITAWNFPSYNPARAWGAILAAGCTLVAKGSEYTPLTTLNLAAILHEAGIPAGVANVINGEAEPIGTLMLSDPRVSKISFTGSTRVGKFLMDGASQTHTRLSLELGGNAPVIVAADVDVTKVAKASVATKFRNCGQVCVSPQRFYVHESIFEAFTATVIEAAKDYKMGSGLDTSVRLGPLINQKQQAHVLSIIAEAKADGAEILMGGDALDKGYFVSPCVVKAKQTDGFIQKEIFGPVMILIPFSTREQVVEWANDTPYGLASYVMTNNLYDSVFYSEQLEFGMVGINEWFPYGTETPFIGWKASGLGHEGGQEGLQEYLEKKLISIGGC
jgi:acyl-CoA reductase-like NAD-dependent aldehyde dehydrogenase